MVRMRMQLKRSCMLCVWALHSCDGCDLALTLCRYDIKKGDLFVLSWAIVRRARRGSISTELLMCLVRDCYVLSRQRLYVGMVLCISLIHSCFCVYVMVMSFA